MVCQSLTAIEQRILCLVNGTLKGTALEICTRTVGIMVAAVIDSNRIEKACGCESSLDSLPKFHIPQPIVISTLYLVISQQLDV